MNSNDMFYALQKIMQNKDFSNILTIGSEQRIDDLQYPLKMRNMQKFAVKDLSKSDKLRKKVSVILHF